MRSDIASHIDIASANSSDIGWREKQVRIVSMRKHDSSTTQTKFEQSFFERPTVLVARELLGTYLCRRMSDGQELRGAIVEVEAYTQDDPACHAFKGLTERCKVLFGPPGNAYVYFIYGMYHCLNVVTERDGEAGAVLIRAVDAEGTDGPGKLCRQWHIDRSFNGVSLIEPTSELWMVPGPEVNDLDVEITPRVGISQAADRMWRFCLKDNPSLSVKKWTSFKRKKRQSIERKAQK